ncbi:Golgi membrane exchange factor (Ric1p-Rgp1p) subunit [Rhizina undulata]
MNDIRVYVTFPESATVFAGEKLECKITFKNVSAVPAPSRPTSSQVAPVSPTNGFSSGNVLGDRRAKVPPLQLSAADRARSGLISPRIPSAVCTAGHRPSLSLTVPNAKTPISPVPPGPPTALNSSTGNKHKRSISIVSLSSDIAPEAGGRSAGPGEDASLRSPPGMPGRGVHSRSPFQILPKRSPGLANGSTQNLAAMPPPPLPAPRGPQLPAPMVVESEPMHAFSFPARRPAAQTVSKNPPARSLGKNFKFPPEPLNTSMANISPSENFSLTEESDGSPRSKPKVSHIDLKSPIEDPDFDRVTQSRVISAHSVNGGTPRSSSEFYSLSNSTTETLVSEYDPRASHRLVKSAHNRRHSLLAMGQRSQESLMMGYAQILGSFTLDGSLIQTSVFEEVKRKGVVGGQMGGGVVGLETSKTDGGFLSGFGWSSFGGLLGGNNMSSLAEMKSIASSKSIPILSTPQSILFVDLRLAPGESRSYNYSFSLPKSLPPSHKGKAIKITYNIVIGTQRPGKGVQQPKVVEIPFRVLPHVDPNGSLRVHDLMSPVVLLHDQATVACVEDQALTPPDPSALENKPKQESSLEDFLSYVDTLLSSNNSNITNSLSILSPSIPVSKRSSFYEEQPSTAKDAIEMAVLRGPGGGFGAGESHCSMFEIARNGRRVASLTLARPAYKLGETITAVIDFTNASVPCYQLTASLETSETVEPSIALRSPSSILRATRRVHAQHSESTLFAQRIVFTPTIPSPATPEFSTSGVSSSWILRLEFITPAISTRLHPGGNMAEDLLEQTHTDERGDLFEARQGLVVESFDASIPVKVYANGADTETNGSGGVGGHTLAAGMAGLVV